MNFPKFTIVLLAKSCVIFFQEKNQFDTLPKNPNERNEEKQLEVAIFISILKL